MARADSSQVKILAFRTVPAALLALVCSTLAYVGIAPARGAESVPILAALTSPLSILVSAAATLAFAVLFAVSVAKHYRLLVLEEKRELAWLREHRRNIMRELADERFLLRWEMAPRRWESRVRDLRRARGWTVETLAELINFWPHTLMRVEIGDIVPGLRVACALADLFDRPIEELFWPVAADLHPERADEQAPPGSDADYAHPAIGSSYARLESLATLCDSGRERSEALFLHNLARRGDGGDDPELALKEFVDAGLLASRVTTYTPTLADRIFGETPRTYSLLSLTPDGRRAVMEAYCGGAGERYRIHQWRSRREALERRYLSVLADSPLVHSGFLSKSTGSSGEIVEREVRGLELRGLVRVDRDRDTDRVALTELGRTRAEELGFAKDRERRW